MLMKDYQFRKRTFVQPCFCKKNRVGFTLVEVLVVVAITGLLATIILVSMRDSRDKGRDAGIKSSMLELTKASEFLYSNTASYEGVCNTEDTTLSGNGDFGRINIYIIRQNGTVSCKDSENRYAIISSLNQADCWCVDSDGDSKEIVLTGSDTCDSVLVDTDCP